MPVSRRNPCQSHSPALSFRRESRSETETSISLSEPITLADGFTVDADVLRLALRLEAAGCPLLVDRAGHLEPLRPADIPRADRRLVSARWSGLSRLLGALASAGWTR